MDGPPLWALRKEGGGVTGGPESQGDVKIPVSVGGSTQRWEVRQRRGVDKGCRSERQEWVQEQPRTGSGQFTPWGEPPSCSVGPGQGQQPGRDVSLSFCFFFLYAVHQINKIN